MTVKVQIAVDWIAADSAVVADVLDSSGFGGGVPSEADERASVVHQPRAHARNHRDDDTNSNLRNKSRS